MLVLSRKVGEAIRIGDGIYLTVSAVGKSRVKISIDAPRDCAVRREEIVAPQSAVKHGAQLPVRAVAR